MNPAGPEGYELVVKLQEVEATHIHNEEAVKLKNLLVRVLVLSQPHWVYEVGTDAFNGQQ